MGFPKTYTPMGMASLERTIRSPRGLWKKWGRSEEGLGLREPSKGVKSVKMVGFYRRPSARALEGAFTMASAKPDHEKA